MSVFFSNLGSSQPLFLLISFLLLPLSLSLLESCDTNIGQLDVVT